MLVASVLGRILIMAGGTGGHVYPALAIARELQQRGYHVQWLGTERGLESRVVPAAGIELNTVTASGFRGKGLVSKLRSLLGLLWASCQSIVLILRFRPGCVIGMGGYAAAPGGLAAWLCRKPMLIHEQNAVAGTANRLLARFATRVMVAYPHAFPDKIKVDVIGNPVREEILAAANHNGSETDAFGNGAALKLLVLGGSLGAKAINDLMPALAARMVDQGLYIWHQTGEQHLHQMKTLYPDTLLSHVRLAAFIDDMQAAYRWADVVICRAGALTVSELTIMALPALLVPYPYAVDDHQTKNARWMTERGAAVLVQQQDLSADALARLLTDFIDSPEILGEMSQRASQIATPLATEQAADICQEVYYD